MQLRLKFGIVLLLITLLLSGAIVGGLEYYKNETLDRNRAAVEETSELAAEQIEAGLAERKDYVGFVASQPAAARFDRIGAYLDRILSSKRFPSGQVIAANGTVVAFRGDISRTSRLETVGADRSDREYFRGALNRSAYVSTPEFAEGVDKHLVVVSAPIFEDGELVGVLALSIYVSDRTFLNSIVPLDTSTRNVEVRTGETVLYESAERFERATTASATVDSVGWTVTVSRDRSQLNARLQNLALAQGLGLFVVLLSVLSFGAWEYRENLQQTERLLDGFASLREGDYDHVVELSSAEEWQQISDGFNELTGALESREQAIREREKLLKVLNRVLRHNLRNEMTVVLSYAEFVRTTTEDDRVGSAATDIETAGQRLDEIGRKARRLHETLEGTDPGRVDHVERVDLVEAVDAAVQRVREDYPAARVDTDLPETAPATAIPDVGFAVENVCENAVVHNDAEEPSVEVAVSCTGGPEPRVRVAVADDGPGIPEHERAVLEKETETPLDHGSGLGLWIVYWVVVSKSGGEVEFEPNEPRGSVVTLVFDAA